MDDLSRGRLENLAQARKSPNLAFYPTDITSGDLGGVVTEVAPEVVFHLAAQIDVRSSVEDPLHDALVNVLGTVRLLEACRRAGTRKVVFSTSGGCIYGEPGAEELPVAEDYDGHPHSPYGASKRSVEEYLHAYQALYGLHWTSLALANVYGPRQDPGGEAGVVSIFGGRMLDSGPVTIYGDGRQTRDFVYVGDVVDAFVRAADRGNGRRFNIGTGEQVSVEALFRELAGIIGYSREPVYGPERIGELRHAAVDPARAGKELGWQPRTRLGEGLAATVDWLRMERQ